MPAKVTLSDAYFRKGPVTSPGQAEQLPQGAAQQLNEAMPPIGGGMGGGLEDAFDAPQEVEWQEEDEPDYKPVDEDEEILFGASEGLGGGPLGNRDLKTRAGVSPEIIRRLPALTRAAKDPRAPASLRAVTRLLADRLEHTLRS